MNKPKIEQLLKYLKRIPLSNFDYGNWFANHDGVRFELWQYAMDDQKPPKCGTAACVAGHACLLFWDKSKKSLCKLESIKDTAKQILGLSEQTAHNLFVRNIFTITKTHDLKYAGRIHAVRRLEHLLKHGNLMNYDFDNEIK